MSRAFGPNIANIVFGQSLVRGDRIYKKDVERKISSNINKIVEDPKANKLKVSHWRR